MWYLSRVFPCADVAVCRMLAQPLILVGYESDSQRLFSLVKHDNIRAEMGTVPFGTAAQPADCSDFSSEVTGGWSSQSDRLILPCHHEHRGSGDFDCRAPMHMTLRQRHKTCHHGTLGKGLTDGQEEIQL